MTVDAPPAEVQFEELWAALTHTRRELEDVRGQLQQQGLLGASSAQLSVGSVGFGTNSVMRLDRSGIQIDATAAATDAIGAIRFVNGFFEPQVNNRGLPPTGTFGWSLEGRINSATDQSVYQGLSDDLSTGVIGVGTRETYMQTLIDTNSCLIGIHADDGAAPHAEINVQSITQGAGTDYAQIYILGAPLVLDVRASDYGFVSDVGDGQMFYRSDTDKFRVRANATMENLAYESYVDTNALSVLSLLRDYKDADQEVTDTTLVSDSELSVSLAATASYHFRAVLFFLNDGAAEGYKCALSGTVGVGDLKAQISIYDDTTNSLAAFARVTALGSSVGAGISSGSNFAVIEGTIETTTAGTFLIQFAQNAAGVNAGVHHEIGCGWVVTRLE